MLFKRLLALGDVFSLELYWIYQYHLRLLNCTSIRNLLLDLVFNGELLRFSVFLGNRQLGLALGSTVIPLPGLALAGIGLTNFLWLRKKDVKIYQSQSWSRPFQNYCSGRLVP